MRRRKLWWIFWLFRRHWLFVGFGGMLLWSDEPIWITLVFGIVMWRCKTTMWELRRRIILADDLMLLLWSWWWGCWLGRYWLLFWKILWEPTFNILVINSKWFIFLFVIEWLGILFLMWVWIWVLGYCLTEWTKLLITCRFGWFLLLGFL